MRPQLSRRVYISNEFPFRGRVIGFKTNNKNELPDFIDRVKSTVSDTTIDTFIMSLDGGILEKDEIDDWINAFIKL